MAATALTERYAANLHGVLSCYDRVIVTGTLPGACYAGGMTSFLFSRGIRIFDYPRFADRFAIESGNARKRSLKPTARASSTSTRAISARKIWWRVCWPSAATRRGSCT